LDYVPNGGTFYPVDHTIFFHKEFLTGSTGSTGAVAKALGA